jgi:hypothetical protein
MRKLPQSITRKEKIPTIDSIFSLYYKLVEPIELNRCFVADTKITSENNESQPY